MQNVTVTISTPQGGVTTQTIPTNMSARQQLEEMGVDIETATVMVNGVPNSLDNILEDSDRLVVANEGKAG